MADYFPTSPAEFISQFPLLGPGDRMVVPETNGIWDCTNGDISLLNTNNGGFTIEGQGGATDRSVIRCKFDVIGNIADAARPMTSISGIKWDCNGNNPGSNTENSYYYFANVDSFLTDCPVEGPGLSGGQLVANVNTIGGANLVRMHYERSLIRKCDDDDMMVTRGASNITLNWMIFEDRSPSTVSDQYFSPHDLGSIIAYNTICRESDGVPKAGASLSSGPDAWIELYNCWVDGECGVPVAENVTCNLGDAETAAFTTGLTKRSCRYLNNRIIGGFEGYFGFRLLANAKDVTIQGNRIEDINRTSVSGVVVVEGSVKDGLVLVSNNYAKTCRRFIYAKAGATCDVDTYDNIATDTVSKFIHDESAGGITWRGGKNFRKADTDVALRGDIVDTPADIDPVTLRPTVGGNAYRDGMSPIGWMMPTDAVGFQPDGIIPGDKARLGARRETRSLYRSIGPFEPEDAMVPTTTTPTVFPMRST